MLSSFCFLSHEEVEIMIRNLREVTMISIIQAAKYLVFLSYTQKRGSLTPLKLQKLLYLAQGWSFVWDNKPIFVGEFEAWQYGPVNTEVYSHFHKYGRNEIPSSEGISDISDTDAKSTLDAIWRDYSGYSAFTLVDLTHTQTPWKKADYYHQVISTEDIKSYFQSTYR